MDKLQIRRYHPSHAERIQQIRAEAFAPIFQSFRDIVGKTLAELIFGDADVKQRQYLSEVLQSPEAQAFVAEIDSQIVGFIHLEVNAERSVGEIGLNAVDPAFAGQGIGTSMYRFAVETFRAQGLKVAMVSTGGDLSHEPARHAYIKAGFGNGVPGVTLYQRLTENYE